MFQIKICGITRAEDARAAVEAGADAVGLNFFSASPRYLPLPMAQQVSRAVPAGVVKVGVFVNPTLQQIADSVAAAGLDAVQLHGDEPPEFLAQLQTAPWPPRPIVRAFRPGLAGLTAVRDYLERCRRLQVWPRMVLWDAQQPGSYGGTGRTADWQLAAEFARDRSLPPLVLAGGLRPDNVAKAIAAVRPAAVDTASGVERAPGVKDAALVAAFVRAAKAALAAS
jgi:phosphoribosylanthranilate isomerase